MIPPIAHQGKPLRLGLAHLTHTRCAVPVGRHRPVRRPYEKPRLMGAINPRTPGLTSGLPRVGAGPSSCRAWRLPTELCGLRATRRRFVSQGCSENPSKRGLRNPITAAIVQSKNRCSEYAGLRNSFLSQEGPSRVLSLVFKRRKNSRVANWLGVCHPCTSLSSRHTTR
jgi:hypothetical protein